MTSDQKKAGEPLIERYEAEIARLRSELLHERAAINAIRHGEADALDVQTKDGSGVSAAQPLLPVYLPAADAGAEEPKSAGPIITGLSQHKAGERIRELNFELRRILAQQKKIELALRDSEVRFRTMADETTIMLWVTDEEGSPQFINRAYSEFFGVPPEAQGFDWTAFLHPDDKETYACAFRQSIAGRVPFRAQARMRHVSGEWRWIDTFAKPRFGSAGEFLGMAGSRSDITEQRQTEEAHSQSEARFRLLSQTASRLLAIDDPKAVLSEISQQIMTNIGCQLYAVFLHDAADNEIKLDSCSGISYEDAQTLCSSPDSVSMVFRGAEFADNQSVLHNYGIRAYAVFPLAAAGMHLGALSFGTSVRETFDDDELALMQTAANQVSVALERLKSAEALRKSEAHLRQITNTIPHPIFVNDREGRLVFANPATLLALGRPAHQVIGFPDAYLACEPAQVQAIVANNERVMSTGMGEVFEEQVDFGKGLRTYLTTKSPYHGVDGTILGIVGIAQDITILKDTEKALRASEDRARRLVQERSELLESERAARSEAEKANRLKDDFLATISHELRTPLNAILGWAKLLSKGTVSAGQAVPVIERSARAQAELIEDLLDMGRILSGKIQLQSHTVPLSELLTASVDAIKPNADEKGVGLALQIEDASGIIDGDRQRLQQVLWNLLSNAVKFTPSGGSVTVTVRRDAELAEIKVTDTGEGIDPAFVPYLFDRFRQADASITKKHRGLGIGLAIAKHITELHGGTIQADSAGKGKGATFTVRLPLAVDQPFIYPDMDERLPSVRAGISIMIVDDEPDAIELLRHILEERGAKVTGVLSAREGLRLLRQASPDIIISDIGMPEMDGYSFIKAIRKLPNSYKSLPAVALTAFARIEDQKKALDSGFSLHLCKPVEPAALIKAVAMLTQERTRPEAA